MWHSMDTLTTVFAPDCYAPLPHFYLIRLL